MRPAVEQLLPATVALGFSEPVARAGLAAELAVWEPDAVATAIADELAPHDVRPHAVLVIAARTLPASTLRQVLAARALGAKVLVKSASGQEALGDALATVDTDIVATPFASADAAALDRAIAEVDAVVALGSDATIAAIAGRAAGKTFVPHGHKTSAAWLDADADEAALRGLALDVIAWDQAGCLAPQVVWVGGDEAARHRLATRLAAALDAVEEDLPKFAHAAIDHAQRVAGSLAVMSGGHVFRTATATVATHPESTFRLSPGGRFIWVLPATPVAVMALQPHLSTLACTSRRDLPELGPAVRLCAPGEMQRPPLAWRQDGIRLFGGLCGRP